MDNREGSTYGMATASTLPSPRRNSAKQQKEAAIIAHHDVTLQTTPLPSPPYLLPDPTEQLKFELLMERFETANTLLASQGLEDDLLVRLESIENRLSVGSLAWIRTQVNEGEFWACVLHDFPGTAAKLPRLLVSKLTSSGGIPNSIRGMVWQAFSQSTDLMGLYAEFQQLTSPYEHMIRRHTADKALARLLAAYSLYDPLVGYNRNITELARPLLTTMPEKEAFGALVR
ncbi:hypothetical protein BX666DRAFT_1967985 [Dichotomocladium elegans]|nr:hypothetical protein BX666DRAFT_1967985 [Dichotomocladium elegans]